MSQAPVEYIIVGFPDTNFNGDIVPALQELVDDGLIRIMDMVFIVKETDGSVTSFEFEDHSSLDAYSVLVEAMDGLFNEEDVLLAAERMEPGTAAAMLVWEDLWATKFSNAVRANGGQLLAGERIPASVIEGAALAVTELLAAD